MCLNFKFIYNEGKLYVDDNSNSEGNTKIIDYYSIKNKLQKNDIGKTEPSNEVIGSFILKELRKNLNDVNCEEILYILSENNNSIIDNVVSYVNSITNREIKWIKVT